MMLRKKARILATTLALLFGMTLLMPLHADSLMGSGLFSSLFASVESPQMQGAYQNNMSGIAAAGTVLEVARYIAQFTNTIMFRVYDIEQQIFLQLQMFGSWFLPDKMDNTVTQDRPLEEQQRTINVFGQKIPVSSNKATTSIPQTFTSYTQKAFDTERIRVPLQSRLTRALFTDLSGKQTASESETPWINDVTFQTLLGKPYFSSDPRNTEKMTEDPAWNYTQNVAGINIKHIIPNPTWTDSNGKSGNDNNAYQQYKAFYKTVSSIQTYNAYLLSELYAEFATGGNFSRSQLDLIDKASNDTWFQHVLGDPNIGHILRELLLFTSQSLVVQSQALKVQKQQLAAQAMTNTLLILGNQFNENTLHDRATGKMPSM